MNGAERSAIFLMTLGEDQAAEIMRHLGPKEVQQLGVAMSSLQNVSKGQVQQVVSDFVTTVGGQTSLGIGNTDYLRSVLVKALGEDRAGSTIDRILMGSNNRGLEQLKWLDARTIAETVRLEHPQIIATVLAYLDADLAAHVLVELPERIRHDIIMRVSSLESIQPAALQQLDEIMEHQFSGKQRVNASPIGGVQSAANIMNYLDTGAETEVMEQIHAADKELGDQIKDLMFVFDDLLEVDDRAIQLLLREVGTEVLVPALKGADDRVKAKLMRNISKRAAEMLQDDLDAKGPVRVSDVEAAQKEILTIARRLADEGQIMLGGSGESFV